MLCWDIPSQQTHGIASFGHNLGPQLSGIKCQVDMMWIATQFRAQLSSKGTGSMEQDANAWQALAVHVLSVLLLRGLPTGSQQIEHSFCHASVTLSTAPRKKSVACLGPQLYSKEKKNCGLFSNNAVMSSVGAHCC